MMTNTAAATAQSPMDASKYAVIRLNSTDNLMGLFQLLLRHGYTQVSFVNNLNQTIFPLQERLDKGTQTEIPKLLSSLLLDQHHFQQQNAITNFHNQNQHQHHHRNSVAPRNGVIVSSTDAGAADGHPLPAGGLNNHHYREKALSTSPPTDRPLIHGTVPHSHGGLDLIPHSLAHFGALTTLPTIPSGFLGLPTLPSIFTPHSSSPTGAGPSMCNSSSLFPPNKLLVDTLTYSFCSAGGQSAAPNGLVGTMASNKHRHPDSLLHQLPVDLGATIQTATNQNANKKPSYGHSPQNHHFVDPVTAAAVTSSVLSTATNTQLRQRGQRGYTDDPSLYVTCRLCKNRIMGSRISNLTNHVRRHSSLKQFQCCYCEYTHNEMAKVRLHMLHNHKDKDSQPIDNLSPEMQTSWEVLMKECFPEHCQSGPGQTGLMAQAATSGVPGGRSGCPKSWRPDGAYDALSADSFTNSDLKEQNSPANFSPSAQSSPSECSAHQHQASSSERPSLGSAGADSSAAQGALTAYASCMDCGEVVHRRHFISHICSRHLPLFFCSLCPFDHTERAKVEAHLLLKHVDDPSARTLTRSIDQSVERLIAQFFAATGSSPMPPLITNGAAAAAAELPAASSETAAGGPGCATGSISDKSLYPSAHSGSDCVGVLKTTSCISGPNSERSVSTVINKSVISAPRDADDEKLFESNTAKKFENGQTRIKIEPDNEQYPDSDEYPQNNSHSNSFSNGLFCKREQQRENASDTDLADCQEGGPDCKRTSSDSEAERLLNEAIAAADRHSLKRKSSDYLAWGHPKRIPYHCPKKCGYSSGSRRRLISHVNLRHNIDCKTFADLTQLVG